MPEGCSLFAVVRDGVATPLRPDMTLPVGDKVIAIGPSRLRGALHEQLIGAEPEASPAGAEPPTASNARRWPESRRNQPDS